LIRTPMRWMVTFVAALTLAGCLDMQKSVHVRADGSGYVEERMVMKGETVAMLKNMAQMDGEAGSKADFQLLDRDKLAEAAKTMGPGVTLASAEAISTPDGEGYVARYAFTDVNQLALDPNPNEGSDKDGAPPDQPGPTPTPAGANTAGQAEARESVRFELRKGDQPVLVVSSPKPPPTASQDSTAPDGPEAGLPEGPERQMAIQMMQQMFKGMRLAVQVEVEGDIVETNAAYRDGSRVTLVDIAFDRILADPERFERLVLAQPRGIQEARALMQGLPGVEVEIADPVEIRFAPR
jgi:hypothetical protein